jgi:phosphoglycolate phosphatase-like HAD superfamily hydrolase
MNKIVTTIDVDGTTVDTVVECYNRSTEAWEAVEKTEFPMSLENFRGCRWSVKIAEQYYQNAKLFELRIPFPESFEELDLLRKKFDASRFTEAFYKSRERATQEMEAWFNEHRLFEGVPQMFKELESIGTINTISTTKDKESTVRLLKHFKIDRFIKNIYAREGTKESADRNYQFKKLLEDHQAEPSSVIAYDDLPEQLAIARSFGFLAVAAPQGYGRNKDLVTYLKARPEEFADLVKSVVERGRK